MKIIRHVGALSLLLLAIAVTNQVTAHNGASGIVKERMNAMETLSDHAKVVGDMLKGKVTFELDAVEAAAAAFVVHGEQIPTLFPDTHESRSSEQSEALPAIWENWEEFTDLSEQFTQNSRMLVSLAAQLRTEGKPANEQSRAVRASFFKTAKNCSGCHEKFRLDQD